MFPFQLGRRLFGTEARRIEEQIYKNENYISIIIQFHHSFSFSRRYRVDLINGKLRAEHIALTQYSTLQRALWEMCEMCVRRTVTDSAIDNILHIIMTIDADSY